MSYYPKIKFCGIRDVLSAKWVIALGVDYAGLVFVRASPRYIGTIENACIVADFLRGKVKIVALVVNVSMNDIDIIMDNISPDYIQFHGDEGTDFIDTVRQKYAVGIIKAVKIKSRDDLPEIDKMHPYCDYLLLDAKPSEKHELAGGNAKKFDWDILNHAKLKNKKWFLAGGLTADNVDDALLYTPYGLDVSSGIEGAKGVKDFAKMKNFIRKAKGSLPPGL